MQEPKPTDNNTQEAQALLAQNALVNAQNASGHLTLYTALEANNYAAISALIEAGAILDMTILNKAKCIRTHLHSRKLLATAVAPKEVQHIIPAIIALTNPKDDLGKRTIFGKDIGSLIALQLLPQILQEKLSLAKEIKLLPGPWTESGPWTEDVLKIVILQNINKAIKKLPPLSRNQEGSKL